MIKDCLPSELTMRHLVDRSRKWKWQFSVNPSEQAVVRAGFRNLELFEKAALIRRAFLPFSRNLVGKFASPPHLPPGATVNLLVCLATGKSCWLDVAPQPEKGSKKCKYKMSFKNVERIANAAQYYSFLSGHYDMIAINWVPNRLKKLNFTKKKCQG